MKILVGVDKGNYTFNAIAKQITLTGLNNLVLEQILLITNATTNEIIYQFNKVGYGGDILFNVITLDFNTTLMNNADSLQIFISYADDEPLKAELNQYTQNNLLQNIYEQLKQTNKLLTKIYQ